MGGSARKFFYIGIYLSKYFMGDTVRSVSHVDQYSANY